MDLTVLTQKEFDHMGKDTLESIHKELNREFIFKGNSYKNIRQAQKETRFHYEYIRKTGYGVKLKNETNSPIN